MNALPSFPADLKESTRLTSAKRPATPRAPLRIGVLTPHNPHDRRAFSGTVFHATRALMQTEGITARVLGGHRAPGFFAKLTGRASPRLDPGALDIDALGLNDLDAVVGLVATGLLNAVAPHTTMPVFHVTDATPGFLREVYKRDVPQAADDAEARLITQATPIYSSRFMAKQASEEFSIPTPAHLAFGVNFDTAPQVQMDKRLPEVGEEPIELLYVGANWTRKGGNITLAAFDQLRRAGVDAHLTLVGRVPASVSATLRGRTDVTLEGFLDKNRPRDQARLSTLFARAHLFVLPTRADCTPMVVAEAMAHRTPVLATDVGAIGEMIGQGAGRILPLTARPSDWAAEIADITRDQMFYAMMADAALDRATSVLSWTNWARGIADLTFHRNTMPKMRAVA